MFNVSDEEITASICRDSFYHFVTEFWDTVVAEQMQVNWHIPKLCTELQIMAERVFRMDASPYDLVVNIPPGTSKSTIVSVMFPAWCLARQPSFRTIVATHGDRLGKDLSIKSRMIVKSKKYQTFFPQVQLAEDRDTQHLWATTAGGMRMCATVGGASPIGFHAHFIIVDDPIDPKEVFSEVEIENAKNFMTNVIRSRKVHQDVTPTALIMQRLHEDDPSGLWLSRMQAGTGAAVRHFRLPATDDFEIYPPEMEEFYKDGLFDPVRLPRKRLKEFEEEGMYAYAGQYGQDPIPLGGGMFKTDRLMICESHQIPQFKKVVRYWDNASTKDSGCFSVGVKMGRAIDDTIWILDVQRGQWASNEREDKKLETAQRDGRTVIIGQEQEPGSSGKEVAEMTVKRLSGFRVKIDRPTGDKFVRADPFSSQVNAGHVRIVKAPWNAIYIHEMKHFGPKAKYLDQIDASSGGYAMLAKTKMIVGGLF